MSKLTIYPVSAPDKIEQQMTDGAQIAKTLTSIGVTFERWSPKAPLPRDADDTAVLAAYADDIDRIKTEQGYITVDVLRVFPDNPKKDEIRAKFLNEHTHDDDEVRFFVEGSGIFYLHANERVYMVLCEAGDFISVPKNTPHWFDMSAMPHITAIRWFKIAEGWVPHFTGQNYSEVFPKYEPKQQAA